MSAWTAPSPDSLKLAQSLRQLAEERLKRNQRIAFRRRPPNPWTFEPIMPMSDILWWVPPTLWGIAGLFAFSFSDQLSEALVRAIGFY